MFCIEKVIYSLLKIALLEPVSGLHYFVRRHPHSLLQRSPNSRFVKKPLNKGIVPVLALLTPTTLRGCGGLHLERGCVWGAPASISTGPLELVKPRLPELPKVLFSGSESVCQGVSWKFLITEGLGALR